MSPDEDALLNGIAADPAADLPRLVYADWLEEHGQDLRAEFIRVQCEIAKLEVGPRDVIDRNVHLWRRQQELIDRHMGELLEGVPYRVGHKLGIWPRYVRGFIDELRLDQNEFDESGDAIATLRPLPSTVAVRADADQFDLLNRASDAARSTVTELELYGEFEPNLHNYLSNTTTWTRVRMLTAVARVVTVQDLLNLMQRLMPSLTSVNLANYSIDDSDIIDLLNAGVLQRLSHISLIENAIGDQAAIELADRLGSSKNLKELDLRRNGITTVGQAALLARLGSKVILF